MFDHAIFILQCCGVAIALGGFFLYTNTKTGAKTSVTALTPLYSVASILLHLALSTSISMLWMLILSGASAIFFAIFATHKRSLYLHALLAGLCASMLQNAYVEEHIKIQALLSSGAHSIKGLIIDVRPWLKHRDGARVTMALCFIDEAPTSGTITFFISKAPRVAVGTTITCFNVTAVTRDKEALVQPYALRDQLRATIFVPYLSYKKQRGHTYYSRWVAWWYTWRSTLYKKIEAALPEPLLTYFSALFLGYKNTAHYQEVRSDFARFGLTHYLARSGLHISLLVWLWSYLFRLMPFPRSIQGLLLAIVLFFYNQLSWASISFNRALWLWFFYIGSWFSTQAATPLFGLLHLTTLILLFNPWQAACLDFQLSFFLTFVLMLYGAYRNKLFMASSCVLEKK